MVQRQRSGVAPVEGDQGSDAPRPTGVFTKATANRFPYHQEKECEQEARRTEVDEGLLPGAQLAENRQHQRLRLLHHPEHVAADDEGDPRAHDRAGLKDGERQRHLFPRKVVAESREVVAGDRVASPTPTPILASSTFE